MLAAVVCTRPRRCLTPSPLVPTSSIAAQLNGRFYQATEPVETKADFSACCAPGSRPENLVGGRRCVPGPRAAGDHVDPAADDGSAQAVARSRHARVRAP